MAKDLEVRTTYRAVDKTSKTVGKIQAKIMRFGMRASAALKKIDRVTSSLARGLGKALKFGALGAAGAATGLFMAINRTADRMDDLAKKTRAIQFPIEEFQEWRFAAEQAGVSSETFDKSLGKFTKTVGELKGGYGAMFTALKKTNPELLEQLKNTDDVSKAFEIYLGAIRNAPNAMDKAALSSAAFGRSGIEMVNIANESAEGIEKLRAQMRQNGVVTAEQARKAERYNDMMNRVKLTVSGLVVNVLTPLMPLLTEAADKFRRWMVANKGLISVKVKEYIEKIPEIIEKIVFWVPKIAKYIGIFYGIAAAVKIARGAMFLFNAAAAINIGPAKKFGNYMGNQLPGQIGKGTGALNKMTGAVGVLGAAYAGWEIGTIIHDQIIEPMMKAHDVTNKMISGISATMDQVDRLPTYALEDKLKEIDKAKKAVDEDTFRQIYDPLGFTRAIEKQALGMAERRVRGAIETRRPFENIRKYGGEPTSTSIEVPEWERPRVSTTATEHRESVEVTIKDETGRATVSKGPAPGKGKGFKLVHSGAMP